MDHKRYDLSKILVTGASGIVGKNVCIALRKKKIKFKKLSSFSENKKFLLEKKKLVFNLSRKISPTLIIHCAIDDKLNPNFIKNVKMIKNLTKFFKAPIIYMSSVAVYENIKKEYLSENIKIKKLSSQYAKVKKICEDIVLSRNIDRDLCLRLPGIFSKKRKAGVISELMKKVHNRDYNVKFFDLDKQWQCINNEHFQICIMNILNSKPLNFKILNIGYNENISLTKAIILFNKKLPKYNKIILKRKTIKTRLNVNNLKKIMKKKLFTFEEGINLILKK